ncbi:MAG: hypothetical protein EZS28_031965, partial [Streblomastix strix]
KITFEIDLREDIPQKTIRIFFGREESPIIFVNVPKQLKIYLAHDNLPGTKYENNIFEIPKPSEQKVGGYEKQIDYNMDLSVLNLEQKEKKKEKQITQNPENNKATIFEEQVPIYFEELLNQMNSQKTETVIITAEEKQTQSKLALQIKNPQKILEKGVFRINNYFMNTQNSRRFGMIADGAEVFNNIPISNKDFRAITYDEKEGILRLGWLEVFKWNYSPKDSHQPWITFEIDLREEIEHNTARLFIGNEESPIIFMDVPKKLKIYVAFEPNTDAKNELQLFKILQPSNAKKIPYTKIIDYNMNIQQEEEKEIQTQILSELKIRQQNDNTPTIGTGIQIADFRGIVSRILTVSNTKQVGGIAVVNSNEIIPKRLSFNSMINLKGIVFFLPEFALYMNGKLLWKRNSSSTSVNQLPVWAYLCLQLDMECDEKTAKFFLGEKLNEEIELGVSKLPPDIQVVILAAGALKAYKSHNTERKGQGITKLVEWIDLSKQDNEQYEQLIEIERKMPLKLKSINQIFEKA